MEAKYTSSLLLLLALLAANGLESSAIAAWSQYGQRSQQQQQPKHHINSQLITRHTIGLESTHRSNSIVVDQTNSGTLVGLEQTLSFGNNNSVFKFLSVPYAEAPIGQLRFKRPVELKDRSDIVVDASEFGKTCPQYRHLTRFISPLLNIDSEHQTSEDCLLLNIYVPSSVGTVNGNKLEPNKRLPVIVWIPGEGFDFADARQFDGSNLAHKTQSIVITVQYRVGVLGFLHAPKLGIKGNMGIYDQLMALTWIKRNIVSFGGDSERITLMGRFSGSMSISAMITAPNRALVKLNGEMLFNRVVMLSGVAVEDWIIDSQQFKRVGQLESAALAKNYCNDSSESCLQNMPVDQLLRIADYGWRLVIDNELIGKHSPVEAIQMNQFAAELDGVLIGETGMEGTLCLYRHMLESTNNNYAQLIEEDKMSTNDLYEIIRYDSNAYFGYNLTKSNPIQAALESMIEDSTERLNNNADQEAISSSKLREKYLNACSSYMVKSHSNRFKRNIVARNQLAENRMDSSKKPVEVFHYELKYKPTFSLAPDYIKTAAHGDDIPLIFGLIYNRPKKNINEADLLMTRKMMAYIGNFVHGNNPLLCQHSRINSKHSESMGSSVSENETSSMDESETSTTNLQDGQSLSGLANLIRRSWSSKGSIHAIEFNENDFNEILTSSSSFAYKSQAALKATQNQPHESVAYTSEQLNNSKEPKPHYEKSNIRVILVESPQTLNNLADLRAQSILDLVSEQQRNQQIDDNRQYEQNQAGTRHQSRLFGFRSFDEPNLLIQNPKRSNQIIVPMNQQQQQQQQGPQTSMTLVNESSFMTMLVFSACIVIFALVSLCFGLCLVIFRNNLITSKGIQHFNATSSASSCNICDDSRGNSIDTVLTGNRKESREFSNVFAKLKNHNHHTAATTTTTQQQCTSTSTNSNRQQQTGGCGPVDLVLHQKVESGTNQQDH